VRARRHAAATYGLRVAGETRDPTVRRLPRGRHGLPREFVVSSQRERLLDATSRAVSELGYPGLTVAAILQRAGVSRKTFYEHFADKEECFLAAYDVVSAGLLHGVSQAYEQPAPWRDRVRAGLAEFLRLLAAEPAFARMCIVEVLAAGPRALQRRDDAMRMFTVFFDAGGDELPPGITPPPLVSESVVGALYEIIYARIRRGETDELPSLLDDLMYVALVPFLGIEEAARR
jgi:AcrR family transcriptional regulator